MVAAVVGSVVSDQEIVTELRAAWAEVSRSYARCWAAMAEVARRTTTDWESAEIAAALTFTTRRADYELRCAQTLLEHVPRVHAAVASGELDHHKARVFTDYLANVTAAQADRICARLVPLAVGWTTGQLAARLLREVHAIDPEYTCRTYEQAVRTRGVHGYLDHTGTAVLTGHGLPADQAAAAAARLETLADQLRVAGYPATVHQTRADLYLRLLDGTLEGLTGPQIQATMLTLGPLTPADPNPSAAPSRHPDPSPPDHQPPPAPPEQPARTAEHPPTEQPVPTGPPVSPAERPEGPASEPPSSPNSPSTTTAAARYGVEVRVRLSTLLDQDEHPAELPGWGPIPATAARDLVAAQHSAQWRIAIVDTEGYLLHGDLTRRRPSTHADRAGSGCISGIVEIALPESMLTQLPTLALAHPEWARVLYGILGSWAHRDQARAALDAQVNRPAWGWVSVQPPWCLRAWSREQQGPLLVVTVGPPWAWSRVWSSSAVAARRRQPGPTQERSRMWTWRRSAACAKRRFGWTSPLGQSYHTRGEPLIPDLPTPLPRDPDPDPEGLPMTFDGSILHRPEPPPPPTRPPPTPLPDEPPF